MSSKWIPDLPLGTYHKFVTSVGAVVAVGSIFVETTFIDPKLAFEMGGAAFIMGLVGWISELSLEVYVENKNQEFRSRGRRGMPSWRPVVLMATLGRLFIILMLVFIEFSLYT